MEESDKPKKPGRIGVPTNGQYYTLANVENSLPLIPAAKKLKAGPKDNVPAGSTTTTTNNKRLHNSDSSSTFKNNNSNNNGDPFKYKNDTGSRVYKSTSINTAPTNTTLSPPPRKITEPTNNKNNKQQIKDPLIPIPWLLSPFVSQSSDRANGRIARVYKLGLRTPEGKSSEVYIILLMYQIIVGAIGGLFVGLETGYLSLDRPQVTGENLPKQTLYQNSLAGTTVVLRSMKRIAIGGLLFNFIEKNIEESRNTSDWKNSMYTGAITGGLFGLRGGLRGFTMGSVVMAGFGGLSGFYDQLKRKDKVK